MEKIKNHTKFLKEHPYPNLYIEKKKRRFFFYKRCHGQEFLRRIPFRDIKTEDDFDAMCKKWQTDYNLWSEEHLKILSIIWDYEEEEN